MSAGPTKLPMTAGMKDHQCGCLKTREMESLTVLEARSLKSGIQQGQPPSEVSREESLLASSSLWGLQLSPGLELHHSHSLPAPHHPARAFFVWFYFGRARLRCCVGPPLVVVAEGYSPAAVHGLLIAVASFEAEHRLWAYTLQPLRPWAP